jgi:hypothetical protein
LTVIRNKARQVILFSSDIAMDISDIGKICEKVDCQAHDFLPFTCSLCQRCYCLEHRSRFRHDCPALQASIPISTAHDSKGASPSVKEMFRQVETRFDSNAGAGAASSSAREHYQVSSSAIPAEQHLKATTSASIGRLQGISESTSNAKEQRVSMKAKEILMKSHAKGDPDLDYERRLYLTCKFPALEIYLYYDKHITIGEFLSVVSQTYPQAGFQRSSKPRDMSLAMHTEDSPDWKLWNHSWKLSEVLSSFETVCLTPISLQEVVMNQDRLERSSIRVESTLSESKPADTSIEAFKAGDLVLYTKSNGEKEVVSIVAVHRDDYPNVYYTILTQATSSSTERHERQTDHARLSTLAPAAAVSSTAVGAGNLPISMGGKLASTAFSIQIQHGTRSYYVIDIDRTISVSQLKIKLQDATGVPWQKCKLICKGLVLKDQMLLMDEATTKIVNGGKISMIGTSLEL